MSDVKNDFTLTDMDPGQITRYKYSAEHNADRVVIVGGEAINIQANIPEFKFPEPIIIEKPIIVNQIEYKEIEKPILIEREKVVYIDRPIVVKEIEIKEVIKEIPIIQEKFTTISVPQIVEKEVFKDYPKLIQIVLIIQAVAIVGLLVLNLVK